MKRYSIIMLKEPWESNYIPKKGETNILEFKETNRTRAIQKCEKRIGYDISCATIYDRKKDSIIIYDKKVDLKVEKRKRILNETI